MDMLKPKDRRTLEIMAAIYGAQGMVNRGETLADDVIKSSVACAILTMNQVQKVMQGKESE